MLIQPGELDDLYKMLARIATRAAAENVYIVPGNNRLFRPVRLADLPERRPHLGRLHGWTLRPRHSRRWLDQGCPTLPSEYLGGNIREQTLSDILDTRELTFNTAAGTPEGTSHMWGFCGECPHARSCRGGCSKIATVTLGRRGNNPYCHYRARTLQERGVRERIVPKLIALGKSFDHGTFRLIEEPVTAAWPAGDDMHFTYDRVAGRAGWDARPVVPTQERID